MDVSQLTEADDVNSAVLVTEVQVTYKSYPVVVLVQELDDDVFDDDVFDDDDVDDDFVVEEAELVGWLVGSVDS